MKYQSNFLPFLHRGACYDLYLILYLHKTIFSLNQKRGKKTNKKQAEKKQKNNLKKKFVTFDTHDIFWKHTSCFAKNVSLEIKKAKNYAYH